MSGQVQGQFIGRFDLQDPLTTNAVLKNPGRRGHRTQWQTGSSSEPRRSSNYGDANTSSGAKYHGFGVWLHVDNLVGAIRDGLPLCLVVLIKVTPVQGVAWARPRITLPLHNGRRIAWSGRHYRSASLEVELRQGSLECEDRPRRTRLQTLPFALPTVRINGAGPVSQGSRYLTGGAAAATHV